MNNHKRPSWSEYALDIAKAAAKRSEDLVKVGACALDFDNRVVAVAYNGLAAGHPAPPGFFHPDNRDARRPYMLHAEVNLLSLVKRGEVRLVACTMLPCSSCAAMLAAYGVQEVVYEKAYTRDPVGLDILRFYGIRVSQIPDKSTNS